MDHDTTDAVSLPADSSNDVLTGILREGAQKMLAQAIESEVDDYVEQHAHALDAKGCTFEPPTRSSRPSRQCDCAPNAPRAVAHESHA